MTVTPFTDEELGVLQKIVVKDADNLIAIPIGKVAALLVRLYAAELTTQHHAVACPGCTYVKEWRLSAAK
jgi:hypothetical protein